MEASIMQTLKTTQEYGGLNIILERKYDQKLYKCNLCNFRANLQCNIWHHKKRDHSDFMLLCDQCGYMTNQLGNLNRHFKAKHSEYL